MIFMLGVLEPAIMSFGMKQIVLGCFLALIFGVLAFFVRMFILSIKETREYNKTAMPTLEELNLAPMDNFDYSNDDNEGFHTSSIQDIEVFADEESGELMKEIHAAAAGQRLEEIPEKKSKFKFKK